MSIDDVMDNITAGMVEGVVLVNSSPALMLKNEKILEYSFGDEVTMREKTVMDTDRNEKGYGVGLYFGTAMGLAFMAITHGLSLVPSLMIDGYTNYQMTKGYPPRF